MRNITAIINAIKETQEERRAARAFRQQLAGNEYTDDDFIGSCIDAADHYIEAWKERHSDN